jgi:aspartate aminotransferase-like enzyme
VLDNLAKAAVAGDMAATRILLDRILPPLRAEETPISLDLSRATTLADKAQTVLTAAASGEFSPSQAAKMIAALGTTARIREVEELEKRIAAIEAAMGRKA